MNRRRALQLRRYVGTTNVPVANRRAVYKALVRWWASIPTWVRKQATARMERGEFAVSLKMPVAFHGAKPPKPRRKRKRRPVRHAAEVVVHKRAVPDGTAALLEKLAEVEP